MKGASTPQSGGAKTDLFPEERSKETREGGKGSQPSEGGTRSPAEVKKVKKQNVKICCIKNL